MKKTYSTEQAAAKIGVGFRTLNRWLALGMIHAIDGIPDAGGRTLWRWTDADIAKGRKVKAAAEARPEGKAKEEEDDDNGVAIYARVGRPTTART